MAIFIDHKKKKKLEFNNSFIADKVSVLASGATIALPIKYISEDNLGELNSVIGLRNQSRNNLLGILFSKPNDTTFLLETAWEDKASNNQHDGDITMFENDTPNTFNLTRLKPDEIKSLFPSWHPYHHENKDFFKKNKTLKEFLDFFKKFKYIFKMVWIFS